MEKEIIRKDWADYYQRCDQSPAAANYREQRIAWQEKNLAEVKERGLWAKELRATGEKIQKPTRFMYDPESFEQAETVKIYRSILASIEEESSREAATAKASIEDF